MDLSSNSMPTKGFWSRPEGTTGMIALAALACVGAYAFSLVLPFVITLLEDTLYAALLAAGVITVGMIVSQKRFWTLISYGFKSVVRGITSIFITIDPIGILKGYIEKLRKWLEDMRQQIEELRGNMRVLQEKMKANNRVIEESMSMAKIARDAGKDLVAKKNARQVNRKTNSNMTYEDLYAKMEAMYKVLVKYSEAAEYTIDDITNDVEEATEKKKLIDKAKKAMSAAKKIFQGASDDSLLYDETMEFLADDYGQKLGEIENFMDMTKSTIEQIDLENMAAEDIVFKQMDQWDEKNSKVINAPRSQKLLSAAPVGNELPTFTNVQERVPVSSRNVTNVSRSETSKYLKN